MDIFSKASYPACTLSNFAPNTFVFDGVFCASMEGLLQSFKFEDVHEQRAVCKLVGIGAKNKGSERTDVWTSVQTLWWKGKSYARESEEYQELLHRAYDALARNTAFCEALLATGNEELLHTVGSPHPTETVLTDYEFCAQLHRVRDRIRVSLSA